jgi:hypothetical protein
MIKYATHRERESAWNDKYGSAQSGSKQANRRSGTGSEHAVEQASAWHRRKIASNVENVLWRVDSAEVEEVELTIGSPMACLQGVRAQRRVYANNRSAQ